MPRRVSGSGFSWPLTLVINLAGSPGAASPKEAASYEALIGNSQAP